MPIVGHVSNSCKVVRRLTALGAILGVLAGIAVPVASASAPPLRATAAHATAAPPTHPADDHMGSTIRQHETTTGPQGSAPGVSPYASTFGSQPLGNDVASYQGNVNWGAVAANGGRFAYVKATEGMTFGTDPELDTGGVADGDLTV